MLKGCWVSVPSRRAAPAWWRRPTSSRRGIRIDRDGPLGCHLQLGGLADGAGLRLWDIAPANVEETIRRYPREAEFRHELLRMQRAEARAVPDGRFALAVRCGLPLATRLAPFADSWPERWNSR